tara:strand:- start:1531 stop:1983 length:453 start_codon:yes stop_codon:yes gene_type:complete
MGKIIKTLPVNILGFIVDSSSMYMLGHYTHLPINDQVYISSIIRILVIYLGHSNYTYIKSMGKKGSNYLIASKFFFWEIFSMIVVNEMVILLNKLIIYEINKYDLRNIQEIVINKKNNQLKSDYIIIIKQLLIIIFYIIVEVRIYEKIFA